LAERRIAKVNPKFKMLNTPVGKIMIGKATIAEMSKKSCMDENLLMAELQRLINERA